MNKINLEKLLKEIVLLDKKSSTDVDLKCFYIVSKDEKKALKTVINLIKDLF